MSRTRKKWARSCRSIRFLKVEASPLEGQEAWDSYRVNCPRRGNVGLEVCLECQLSGRMILDDRGVPVRLACGLRAEEQTANSKTRPLTLVR